MVVGRRSIATEIVNGILVSQGRILMGLRSTERRTYANTWSFSGGHVETGETLEDALLRELQEEIGVTAQSSSYLGKIEQDGKDTTKPVRFSIYLVSEWEGEIQNLGEERSELRWVGFQEGLALPNLALPEYKALFHTLNEASELL